MATAVFSLVMTSLSFAVGATFPFSWFTVINTVAVFDVARPSKASKVKLSGPW